MNNTRVCMSGDGQGHMARAIMKALVDTGDPYQFVQDAQNLEDTAANVESVDVAVCTTGRMLIRDPALVTPEELAYLYRGNYLLPRCFTERHIKAMKRDGRKGLILHLGSNAAWYGNIGAEDYAAFKSALRKYLELRGRAVRDAGIRISCLGFGGIDTGFWVKATAGADPAIAASIVPGTREPLSAEDAAALVVATIKLPARLVLRDALAVAVDYQ